VLQSQENQKRAESGVDARFQPPQKRGSAELASKAKAPRYGVHLPFRASIRAGSLSLTFDFHAARLLSDQPRSPTCEEPAWWLMFLLDPLSLRFVSSSEIVQVL
jgi:hypothetical protein